MKLRLATWNINSVRLRIGIVERFIKEYEPDILCLQEIKCKDELFPYEAIQALDYTHIHVKGQAGYHGVATVSRIPLSAQGTEDFCGSGEARHIAVSLDGKPLIIHNVYIPAGGDIPDPEVNPKFGQKLSYLNEMTGWFLGHDDKDENRMIMVGDLNVAPLESDVWSHKQLLKVVSHTPVEVDHLNALRAAQDWVDVMRQHVPAEEQLFTWWSYRARDWRRSNRGRRLDHVWVTPALGEASCSMQVVDEARDWERPSDHVPVLVEFDLAQSPEA